ncbi:hypothetical protein ALP19_101674 [Pseudomonas syringae pv. tomato]|nr:hypothetical protein ALP19_101674 [Pseudomonas syringae pv. tomato]
MGIPVDFSEPLWQRITMTASNGPLAVRFRERAPLWFKAEVLDVAALFMGHCSRSIYTIIRAIICSIDCAAPSKISSCLCLLISVPLCSLMKRIASC